MVKLTSAYVYLGSMEDFFLTPSIPDSCSVIDKLGGMTDSNIYK